MPGRKSLIHLDKIGFETRISVVGEVQTTYGNDKKEKEGTKLRAVPLEFLKSQFQTPDFC